MDKLVYLCYPLALLLLFWGSKWYGRKQWNEESFSLSQTKAWQGFFAVMILLHHVGQKTCASWLDRRWPRMPGLELFVPIGYYFVAFFLVCSGFGLYKSWKSKENYLKGFVKKRVSPRFFSLRDIKAATVYGNGPTSAMRPLKRPPRTVSGAVNVRRGAPIICRSAR